MDDLYGKCRRFPPVLDAANAMFDIEQVQDFVPTESSDRHWIQPITTASTVCGEFHYFADL